LEGVTELGLELQKLSGFAMVVNQLAEAASIGHHGHTMNHLSQGAGKDT
jgi:hypothetical protein